MIPKIIHYCWFGRNPLPPLAQECIASWKRFFPGYEIKEWNEDNFDVNCIPYTAEAYKVKKYAYVSDYARFVILYQYGGIYFDTDVEVVKSMDDVILKGPFMGFERDPDFWGDGYVAPGLGLAVNPKMDIIHQLMDKYQDLHFLLPDGSYNIGQTIVHYTTQVLSNCGLQQKKGVQELNGISIYPSEFFAPINFITRRLHITENTRTIHRYMASWVDQKNKTVYDYIKHYMPEFILIWINRLKNWKNWRLFVKNRF